MKASGWRKPGRLHNGSLWTEGVRGGPGRSKTFQVEKQGQESGMLNNSMLAGLSESQIGPFHSLFKEFQIICLNRWIFSLHPKFSLIIIAK